MLALLGVALLAVGLLLGGNVEKDHSAFYSDAAMDTSAEECDYLVCYDIVSSTERQKDSGGLDVVPIWWILSGSINYRSPTAELEGSTSGIQSTNYQPRSTPSYSGLGYARDIICAPERLWPCDWAMAVVACESTFQENAVGTQWYRGQLWYFYGWFQIASLIPPGGTMDWLFDPINNTAEAHYKFMNGGTRHWPNCP